MPDYEEMIVDVKTVQLEAQNYLYIEGSAPLAEPAKIGAAMGEAFGQLMAFFGQNGIAPAAAPIAVYTGYDPETLTFRAGMPVDEAEAGKAAGDVKADALPAGEAFHFVHVGPYAGLRDSYQAAEDVVKAKGQGLGAPTWEVYVNDPATTPEAELRTEIYSVPGPVW